MDTLIKRMVRIYGLEHPIVIQFTRLVELGWEEELLEAIVEAHEEFPEIICVDDEDF